MMEIDMILTFCNAHDAIRAEEYLVDQCIPVKLMQTPEEFQALGNLCLRIKAMWSKEVIIFLDKVNMAADEIYLVTGRREYRKLVSPNFSEQIGLEWGDVVSIIGCGGKTSLMYRLTEENRYRKILFSTTTKIEMPPETVYDHILEVGGRMKPGVNLMFERIEGKIKGVDHKTLSTYLPSDGLTLLEADGSKGLPLKAWHDYEPVIPEFTTVTVGVCAIWPIGRPCTEEWVHRCSLFCKLTGASVGKTITIDHVAAMIGQPMGMFGKAVGRKILIMNQVKTQKEKTLAQKLGERIQRDYPGVLDIMLVGSVHEGSVNRIETESGERKS